MALPAILGIAGLLGGLFGKGAEKSAQGRATESDILQRGDMIRNSQYGTQQGAEMNAGQLDLQRKGFTEDARGNRAKQAAIADLLMGQKPTSINVPGIRNASVSGGMSLGEGGKAGLAAMQQQALAKLLMGDKADTFEGGQVLTPPPMSRLPQASGWEKLSGVLGTVGSLAGGLGQTGLFGEPAQQAPYMASAAPPSPEGLSPEILKRIQQMQEPRL